MPYRTTTSLLAVALNIAAIAQSGITCTVDLRQQDNDRLTIEMQVPAILNGTAILAFPRIVPGIYGAMDHGRLVGDLQAYDANGQLMPTQRLDLGRWAVPEASALERLTYTVDDGWEEFDILFMQGNFRSSEGTLGPGAAVLNHNTLFGYFEGYEHLPYTIRLMKPATHYAATSLPRTQESTDLVTFAATSYRHLVDNPMLVAPPDTAHIRLADINVTVACHSTTGQPIAAEVATYIRPLLADQRAYLGGVLPVKDYTFLILHNPSDQEGSSMGDGLEHSASTLILLCMPLDPDAIAHSVYGIASHEFFHTILPLSVHSEEIEHYDFRAPRMSRHLWLYEGMTEYFAMHMPVKQARQSVDEFLAVVQRKMEQMQGFTDSIALTELSMQAMERQDQYYNFYLKGTLFCMGLDIALRERSKGAYGVQELVRDLQREYGVGKPFKDEELFATITRLTGPDIGALLQRYLNEPGPLPLAEWFAKAGIALDAAGKPEVMPKPTAQQVRLRKAWLGR